MLLEGGMVPNDCNVGVVACLLCQEPCGLPDEATRSTSSLETSTSLGVPSGPEPEEAEAALVASTSMPTAPANGARGACWRPCAYCLRRYHQKQ